MGRIEDGFQRYSDFMGSRTMKFVAYGVAVLNILYAIDGLKRAEYDSSACNGFSGGLCGLVYKFI